jgi:glycosyltransferase involved in cell wall biosynthesis
MRVFSLVVTVRNDRDGLKELLPALERQTVPPAELIVVDGGSVDGTLEVIDEWRPAGFPVRVAKAPGSNIAEGRNVGVALAQQDWIAVTDAGCRPDPGWLEALVRAPADADVISGIFISEGRSDFERVASLTHYPVRDELADPSLLVRTAHRLFGRDFREIHAGGRSMAFKKRAWESVGGFPADHYAGEDLAFTASLLHHGYRSTLAPDAVIRWRPPRSWGATARMFFIYSRGDVRRPPRIRHALRAMAWLGGLGVSVRGGWPRRAIVTLGFLSYVGLPLRRVRRAGIPIRHWWRVPAAVAVKDLAQLAGAAAGLTDIVRGRSQPNPHAARPRTDGPSA